MVSVSSTMKMPPQKEFLLSKKTTNAAQKDLGNSATVVIKAAKNSEDKVKASLHFFFPFWNGALHFTESLQAKS